MSFLTSLSLSFNNLRTKKGRTVLTAFAGSIGIIGIALILALSTGVNDYIEDIQKETMTAYPITIRAEALNMSSMQEMRGQRLGGGSKTEEQTRSGVYMDVSKMKANYTLVTSNNLTKFKQYLDDPAGDIQQYLGENGVVYGYDVSFSAFSYDAEENLVNSDASAEDLTGSSKFSGMNNPMMGMMLVGSSGASGAENFSELMAGADGSSVSRVISDSYDVLYGAWPENYDEVILALDENNALPAETLYQLGFITADEYKEIAEKIENGEETGEMTWDYAELCGHTFYLVPACDRYVKNGDDTFSYLGESGMEAEQLLENSVKLKITGVVRPKQDAGNASVFTALGYTSKLTDYIIRRTNESEVVKAQEADPETNVLNGMRFEAKDDEAKAEDAKKYASGMGISDKASLYRMILYLNAQKAAKGDPDTAQKSPAAGGQMVQPDERVMAAALDRWLAGNPDEEILLSIYDQYIGGAAYEDNLKEFGKVSYDAPSSISIYTDSFEDKEAVSACIEAYNEGKTEDDQITYTDFVKLMTESLTTIIDVISGVLIAFVAVSLVVSCIMIGIITHISVLERTKEIGILRALGASKRNISQVFNAETVIIGFCSGLLGVGVAALLTVPITAVIRNLLGDSSIAASLPVAYAAALVVLSMVITVIGGLLPAKKAAKKDPVIALRTE